VSQLKVMMAALENAGPPTDIGAPPVVQAICVRGRVREFTDAFFDQDVPVKEISAENEVPCLTATLFDDSGAVMVKLWDKACEHALGISSSKLKEFWERDVQVKEARPRIMQNLNTHSAVSYHFTSTLKLWTSGCEQIRSKAQVDLNSVMLASLRGGRSSQD
jgi:hypothetical protein